MELYAIVRAAKEWGHEWRGKKILFIGDCLGLTQALHKNYLRRPAMAALLRVLANCAVRNEFEWRCRWIRGVENKRADRLSRGPQAMQKFFEENPTMSPTPASQNLQQSPINDAFY
jgi:hypothetical protein